MADASSSLDPDTFAAFVDTSVLFDYALDEEEDARILFVEEESVGKTTSMRGHNEFMSVVSRRKELHKALRYQIPGELEDFDPDSLDFLSDNDWGYLIDLFDELRSLEDDTEILRRLNEEKRKLKTAQRELFDSSDSFVEVIDVGPIDIRLRDRLATQIDNMDDVRLLCDAVEWTRDDGTGTFLTTDEDDFLEDTSEDSTEETDDHSGSEGNHLSASLEEFTDDGRSLLDRINDAILERYSEEAVVVILTTEDFLAQL